MNEYSRVLGIKKLKELLLVLCKTLKYHLLVSKKPIFGFADIKLVLSMNEGVWFYVVSRFQSCKQWECSYNWSGM